MSIREHLTCKNIRFRKSPKYHYVIALTSKEREMVFCNKEVKACSWQNPLVLNPMTSNCYEIDLDHSKFRKDRKRSSIFNQAKKNH